MLLSLQLIPEVGIFIENIMHFCIIAFGRIVRSIVFIFLLPSSSSDQRHGHRRRHQQHVATKRAKPLIIQRCNILKQPAKRF